MHNISHALRRAELIAADSEGFVCGDARMTFGEFVARTRRLGTVLADLGVERGGRVAVISFNSIPHVELYSGVPASGRVVVPLNFRWADAELQYALEDSGGEEEYEVEYYSEKESINAEEASQYASKNGGCCS